jgi:hypothetical protein
MLRKRNGETETNEMGKRNRVQETKRRDRNTFQEQLLCEA